MGMDVAPVSALLLAYLLLFSPFEKDNVLYFSILFWILLRIPFFLFCSFLIIAVHPHFFSPCLVFQISLYKSPFAGLLFFLGYIIVNSAVLFIAYQGTFKLF